MSNVESEINPKSKTSDSRVFDRKTAVAVVVANMIGTGVFTSLGFQLVDIQTGFSLLMLWVVGGLVALCGALSYAELGAALPRSGGEYNFLTHCYHPAAGFVSGWISSTIGFAAPVALAAMTFGAYLTSVLPWLNQMGMALGIILILSLVHASNRKNSAGTQWLFTLIKLALIAAFCLVALLTTEKEQAISFLPRPADWQAMLSGTFAVSLIYVNYAYNGWNAATYLSSELESPQRDLPRILFIGTGMVLITYVALNFVFLFTTPIEQMKGKIEVGFVVAQSIFGDTGAKFTGIIMSLLLVSTVSAMTLAGPRVLQVIGEDFRLFGFLAKVNGSGIPTRAIFFQSALAMVFVVTSTFESILVFAGFALALNNFFAVLGVFILRYRQPERERPYQIWLYPAPPLIFLLLTGWTLVYLFLQRPLEAGLSLGLIFIGLIFYIISRRF